jgi:heat shock protein HspQ
MTSTRAKFAPGALVCHKLFDYRSVVIDVDSEFQGTAEWYEAMARSRPPKDQPWYHVLVDGAEHDTYVAEGNLEPDGTGRPIDHPAVGTFFANLGDEGYIPHQKGK